MFNFGIKSSLIVCSLGHNHSECEVELIREATWHLCGEVDCLHGNMWC